MSKNINKCDKCEGEGFGFGIHYKTVKNETTGQTQTFCNECLCYLCQDRPHTNPAKPSPYASMWGQHSYRCKDCEESKEPCKECQKEINELDNEYKNWEGAEEMKESIIEKCLHAQKNRDSLHQHSVGGRLNMFGEKNCPKCGKRVKTGSFSSGKGEITEPHNCNSKDNNIERERERRFWLISSNTISNPLLYKTIT